ncbi:hypothetical protein [Actinoplanes sp. NBRC 103695]|uniref:hypothetical protein n=1 Tax=Actinoplanes sp. NBRC 103695 TaxID=3032202 RepID=UPI0024A21CB0|nr:hypothetical protein [Actinoplanes sp. NBRC 103695]GLZ02255.1 hypothetical protein Acsp02_95060 [Actinoplanes sp. NBRC 103695]
MNDVDLRTALHEWAGQTHAGQPPIAELISRGAARRRRRHLTRAGTAAMAVAVLAAAVAAGGLLTAAPATKPTAAPSPPPLEPRIELAAAITSTSEQSFRFVVESELTMPMHETRNSKGTCSGVIDPATQTGYAKFGDLNEHWAVNGRRYLRQGNRRYALGAGKVSDFIACPIGRIGDPGFVNADPVSLLHDLAELATIRKTTNGNNPTTTYTYTATGIHGTITVTNGKVHTLTSTVDNPASHDKPAYHREITMTLTGYGDPVKVKAPW